MVYFPETGPPATADTKTVAAVWAERIDSEYREMPGLRLTLAQAARLWGLQPPQCLALLGALVERGRLVETPEGLYCVGGRPSSSPSSPSLAPLARRRFELRT